MLEILLEFFPQKVTCFEYDFNQHFHIFISATGEPALLLGISVLFAIWDALNSSREDAGQSGWWQLSKNSLNSSVSSSKLSITFRWSSDCGAHSPTCWSHAGSIYFLKWTFTIFIIYTGKPLRKINSPDLGAQLT